MFIKPCQGRITSHFNLKRLHPTKKAILPHYGTDFGNHADNYILAAADGTVTRAQFIAGYGNVIYIDHVINGIKYQTRYAHLRSFNVGAGTRVKQGKIIGVKGTTGDSTGIHLHFEVRVNGVARDPVGYINDPSIALSKGIVGPRVGDLQRALNLAGYNLVVDNSFGPATDKAVRDLQRKNKLAVDGSAGVATFKVIATIKPKLKINGKLDKATITALQEYFGTTADGKLSKPSMVIRTIQKWLGTKEDGFISDSYSLMVAALQEKFGMKVIDGKISVPYSNVIAELQRRLNKGQL